MKRVLFFFLILLPIITFSQGEASVWYFGRYSGLDFNTSPPTVIDDVSNDFLTYEGCATISNCNGLLFYTDGVKVWDNSHTIMTNGTGLFGNPSSTQSAIIVPRPLNSDHYYIFTTGVNPPEPGIDRGLNYSLVDLNLGTNGDVDPAQKNINLVGSRAFEKLAAVNKSNNVDYWVITYYENRFSAWTVDAAGVNTTPVISTAGISNSNSSRGYLKISPDGTKIVSANFGINGTIMLYDFNNATGVVSNETELFFDNATDIAYGVEFSSQSSKLYATTCLNSTVGLSSPSKLYQFDLSNANNRTLIHSTNLYTRGAIQLGIDGKIYRALASAITGHNLGIGTSSLGVINDPELVGIACNYVDAQIDLSNGGAFPNNLVFEGLPPFISSSFLLPNIAGTDACLGTPNNFIINSTCTVDSVIWDFGEIDPATGLNFTSTDLTPTHIYATSGVFTVSADITIGGVTETSTIDVTVFDLPIVSSPVIISECDDNIDGIIDFDITQANTLITSEIPTPTITYFLTEQAAIDNDSTNEILTPNSFSNNNSITTNTVWARIINANNCVATSEINLVVTNINIPPNLVTPFTVCDDITDGDNTNGFSLFDFSSATNSFITGLLPEINLVVTYYETQTDALNSSPSIDPTNFRNTIITTQDIIVRVENTVTGCLGLTTLTLNVLEIPQFDVIPATTICLFGETQIVSVENEAGNYTYEWFDSSNTIIGTESEIEIGLVDTYTVIATDATSLNCTNSRTIDVISEPVMPLLNFDLTNIKYTESSFNQNTITILIDNLPISTYQFALNDSPYQLSNVFENLEAGVYTVTIRDISNCLEAKVTISIIYIPNFFTPNGDGSNDTWHVTGIEFQPDSNVYIFDRFGKLIKILNPLEPGWNGFYKGNPLPSTDYWYKVELEDGRLLKGHFSLIR